MYQLNRYIVPGAALVAALTLTACGGGSSGSGGGGGSTGGQSSTIVVNSSGLAMSSDPLTQPDGPTHIAAVISDLLIRHASAAAGDIVTIYGCEFGGFDELGRTFDPIGNEVYIPVMGCDPYKICIGDVNIPLQCMDVTVGADMVVYVNVEKETKDVITLEEAAAVPGQSHKRYICHKNNTKPLKVASTSFEKAHLMHGDTLTNSYTGCAQENSAGAENQNNNGNKGNQGNNGNKGNENRCNKGNKPKKGCPVNDQV